MGRDLIQCRADIALTISIHAPAWGATACNPTTSTMHADFNPRARVGRDKSGSSVAGRSMNFNPRARVGRDTSFTSG